MYFLFFKSQWEIKRPAAQPQAFVQRFFMKNVPPQCFQRALRRLSKIRLVHVPLEQRIQCIYGSFRVCANRTQRYRGTRNDSQGHNA